MKKTNQRGRGAKGQGPQANAACAEESASASEELSAQADELNSEEFKHF